MLGKSLTLSLERGTRITGREGRHGRKAMAAKLIGIYYKLLSHYGKQDWWPASGRFKPSEWEICMGAVLTQNTNWRNVERALENMEKGKVTAPADIKNISSKKLEALIRPSGFFSQKASNLKELAKFVLAYENFEKFSEQATREELLKIKGIGHETADSILLYACGRPFFVIDAYTRRVFHRLGLIGEGWGYEKLREFFENSLPKKPALYNEFHALIVRHAKTICRKEPLCSACPLEKICEKNGLDS